jgi:hypothetical protein
MERIQFTRALLEETLRCDGATLLSPCDGRVTGETRIAFRCKCETQQERKFCQIIRSSRAFCKVCVEHNRQEKIKNTNIERYGVDRPSKSDVFKQKTIETNIQKYGHPSSNQSDFVKAKKVESYRERLGVDNPAQSETVKEKAKRTNLEVYGCENPFGNDSVKSKIKTQMMARYGVENPSQSAEFQAKKVGTTMVKFGVPYAMQNPDVFERSQNHSHCAKDFAMPSGTIRRVRGYEPFALRDLLDIHLEDQIKTGKGVPSVKYMGVDGKEHKYYPDIYIPHENKIIEVKGEWTYRCDRDKEKNARKKAACEEFGYLFEYWVYTRQGNRIVLE